SAPPPLPSPPAPTSPPSPTCKPLISHSTAHCHFPIQPLSVTFPFLPYHVLSHDHSFSLYNCMLCITLHSCLYCQLCVVCAMSPITRQPPLGSMIEAEMEEGVDIQQTASLHDTKQRYLDITTALVCRYNDAAIALHRHLQHHAHAGGAPPSPPPPCPLYGEFVATCRSVQSDSVCNLFGHLLLQVRCAGGHGVLLLTAVGWGRGACD
ncbi:unnamed protein product, partial [Closterium sp. NIES-54]